VSVSSALVTGGSGVSAGGLSDFEEHAAAARQTRREGASKRIPKGYVRDEVEVEVWVEVGVEVWVDVGVDVDVEVEAEADVEVDDRAVVAMAFAV
jgi:hypothetical protein